MNPLLPLLLIVPAVLWGSSTFPDLFAADAGFWQWRRAIVLFSGVLALWWMSAGILLAMRPAWLERALGGLDRLYRLHRNVGIGAGVLVFVHWMSEWGVKNLGKLGLLPPRVRGPKGDHSWLFDFAKDVGEWAGYIALALVVVALLRRIPYRAFRLMHMVFALVFVAGAFHGVVMMPRDWWSQPLAWTTAALAALGTIAAVWSLSGRVGRSQKHVARVEAVSVQSDGVVEVVLRPEATWPGHRAGQFLLVDFGHRLEGAHPFTIASAWSVSSGTLTLAIKALGDYTRSLPQRLHAGDRAMIEGPYGRFDFDAAATPANSRAQVWVAGGIGVTPFLARLKELRHQGLRADGVDLFYSIRNTAGDAFREELDALCRATGVRLHRWFSDTQGVLSADLIAESAASGRSVWFCGPAAWGESLAHRLGKAGIGGQRFHRECFEFR